MHSDINFVLLIMLISYSSIKKNNLNDLSSSFFVTFTINIYYLLIKLLIYAHTNLQLQSVVYALPQV